MKIEKKNCFFGKFHFLIFYDKNIIFFFGISEIAEIL